MNKFDMELVRRLPLASAVLELFDHALEPGFLEDIYEHNRGRGYTAILTFSHFVTVIRDCLVIHRSGHRGMLEAQAQDTLTVDDSNIYRKLARMPVAVSQALLRQSTQRLKALMPEAARAPLPPSVDKFDVIIIDGKKIKDAAKRLKPCRGFGGKLHGAKVLVAVDARSGLALAMHSSLDGESNDVPLVRGLLPQVREHTQRPVLWIADRQFGDLTTPGRLSQGEDQYLVRLRKGLIFQADPAVAAVEGVDEQGRAWVDQVGWLGKGRELYVRRIELLREGEDQGGDQGGDQAVILITSLLDREVHATEDLLELYRRRWGIEQCFQQVVEQFELRQLIGCTPRAILFQTSFCLLLYNLVQVVKAYVAEDAGREPGEVSTHQLFVNVRRELTTWTCLEAPPPESRCDDAESMRRRLRELMHGRWRELWTKRSDTRPREKRPKPKPIFGGHTSVWRLLHPINPPPPIT